MKVYNDSTLTLTVAAGAFAALGSEQRLAILQTLVRAGPDGLSIGALGERTEITGSTLTHHLKFLTTAELVTQEKQGRSIMCFAAYETAEELSAYLLRNCCADSVHTPTKDHSHV